MKHLVRCILMVAALGATACVETGYVPVPELDGVVYVDHVHPVVRFSCASLDCHGVEGRPLRIYAEDGLRLRPELRGQPLDPGEVTWNVAAFGGLDPEATAVERSLVLLKPLATSAGGVAHEGEDVWADTDDPAYVCLHAWLSGTGAQSDATTACDTAAAQLDPYP